MSDCSNPDQKVAETEISYEQWFKLQQYQGLFDFLDNEGLNKWTEDLKDKLPQLFDSRHGAYNQWFKTCLNLPQVATTNFDVAQGYLNVNNTFSHEEDFDLDLLKQNLKAILPWRKGPYTLNSVSIDTEWRSDYKWERIKNHLSPLEKKSVLDIGCGNGYHCWRMHEAGAKMVVGVDPSWLFLAQFQVVKHFMGDAPVYLLPMGIEDLPLEHFSNQGGSFDTVFSMGVLYHRRSPLDHLLQLKQLINKTGELVLETLIIDGVKGESLVPDDRYAKMRNVWFLPSVDTLTSWMRRCGFINIRVVDVNQTSEEEQHSTEWVPSESLIDFLDPTDKNKTIEGYPAPKRVVIIANK